jgi:hypothetical protein
LGHAGIAVHLSIHQVTNLLSYHLTGPSVRLSAQCTTDFIFVIEVASANVATVVFLSGPIGRDN